MLLLRIAVALAVIGTTLWFRYRRNYSRPWPMQIAIRDNDFASLGRMLGGEDGVSARLEELTELTGPHTVSISGYVTLLGRRPTRPHLGMHLTTFAAMRGSRECLALLLDAGADVNAVDSFGQTALIAACWGGRVDCVRDLLSRGADASLTDAHGRSAKDWARICGFREIEGMLAVY